MNHIEHTGLQYDAGKRIYWIEAEATDPIDHKATIIIGAFRNHISDDLNVDVVNDQQAEDWLSAILEEYRNRPDLFNVLIYIDPRHGEQDKEESVEVLTSFLVGVSESVES